MCQRLGRFVIFVVAFKTKFLIIPYDDDDDDDYDGDDGDDGDDSSDDDSDGNSKVVTVMLCNALDQLGGTFRGT